jgi:hypothetical protein
MLSVVGRDSVDDIDFEAALGSKRLEHTNVACAPVAKAMVVPDEQVCHAKTRAKNSVDELFSAVRREVMRKRYDGEIVDAGFREHFELFFARGEKQRRSGGIYYLERVRIEAHHDARHSRHARSFDKTPYDVDVPAMDSIERPDGHDGPRHRGRQP